MAANGNAATPVQVAAQVVRFNGDPAQKQMRRCSWGPWICNSPGPLLQKYFSRSYVHLWECALRTGENIWDGDFLSGAQGVERQWLVSAHQTSAAGQSVHVRVALKELAEGEVYKSRLEFVFVQEDQAWKIDNIIFLDNIAYNERGRPPKMDESFREAFKRYACK